MDGSSLLGLLTKGGLLVWPILGCSVIGLAIFLNRFIYLTRMRGQRGSLVRELERNSSGRRYKDILVLAKEDSGPIGRMLTEAMSICCKDRAVLETVLDFQIDKELTAASKYMDALSTLGAITPVMGLLGTVTGLIKAFMVIERAGGGVDATMLAGGIWEAMLTTALGLSVALPIIIGHRFLKSRISSLEEELQLGAIILLKAAYSIKEGQRDR